MKLEDQVCTPEQGRRLKELGIAQKSLFYWTGHKWGTMPRGSCDFEYGQQVSQFTAAELGIMLPDHYGTIADRETRTKERIYPGVRLAGKVIYMLRADHHKMEARSRADLLIRLLNEGGETVENVNKRLLDSG